MNDAADAAVLIRRQGRIGRMTLNRPRSLNALDAGMIQTIGLALEAWRSDPAVHAVVIDAAGERAFCAGGDVRAVRDAVLRDRFDEVEAFFVGEYALNRTIARYPKPYLALVDGICMGGGMGLSVHGAFRVASENAVFAMPETQLGLFPDVGASYFLPRLRGAFGMYMGLTGTRIGGGDARWVGLATHFLPRAEMPALVEALATDGVAVLADLAGSASALDMPPLQADVDRIFGQSDLADIHAGLAGLDASWAQTALAALDSASPSALHWTFELLRAGAGRTFDECQWAETLLTRRACRHPDFAEGVRANVVDKDRRPRWQKLAN